MKPKSTSATIRHIKTRYKKVNYRQAITAIERKLEEIRKPGYQGPGKEVSMALFGNWA